MALKITKAEVWAGDLRDVPGGVADALASLARAGANLEFLIARRDPSRPGIGQIFLTPVKGKQAQAAASAARLSPARDIGTLRVEGPNRAGVGHDMTRAIADAGINLRGVSAAVLGNNFIAYFGFDSVADANRAAKVLSKVGQAGGATARRRGRSASKR